MLVKALLDFVERLQRAKLHHEFSAPTERAVMVSVRVPGEYWEIEFHEDGDVGVEVFRSVNGVEGKERLDDLFMRHGDSTA
jgi:hypothetical protein